MHNDSSRSVTRYTFTHRKLEQHREQRQHKGVLSKIAWSLVPETFACVITDQNQTLKQKARLATIRTQVYGKRKTHIHVRVFAWTQIRKHRWKAKKKRSSKFCVTHNNKKKYRIGKQLGHLDNTLKASASQKARAAYPANVTSRCCPHRTVCVFRSSVPLLKKLSSKCSPPALSTATPRTLYG